MYVGNASKSASQDSKWLKTHALWTQPGLTGIYEQQVMEVDHRVILSNAEKRRG
jgi:hypothetical protein